MSRDLTTEILVQIRDEIRSTNSRLDTTNSRLDTTNARMDRLERRQVESELRISTELTAVVSAVNAMHETLKTGGVRAQVNDLELRVAALEAKVG